MNLLYALPGAFLAPIIHEWVKAMCSARLGDPTPKQKGFLRGNPLSYFEPVGFILMLIIGFGWGQPVPTSPLYYRDRRRGVLITFITPSIINLLIGIAAAALARLIGAAVVPVGAAEALGVVFDVLLSFARLNIGLAFYNLIPVYPMDCARILQLFLNPGAVAAFNRNEKVLQVLLLVLLFFGLPQIVFGPMTGAVIGMVFSV